MNPEVVMPQRKADARWEGSLEEGHGVMRVASGAYEGPYSFQSRFQEGDGTNPEELIAGAHAGCFSMALAADLGQAGYEPETVDTTATVHLEMGDGPPTIARIDLDTRAKVSGVEDDEFQKIAEATKENCPVSRALAAVATVNVNAELVG
jgi:osmotically inducible protein OsmC